jgi:hypothetical protein
VPSRIACGLVHEVLRFAKGMKINPPLVSFVHIIWPPQDLRQMRIERSSDRLTNFDPHPATSGRWLDRVMH